MLTAGDRFETPSRVIKETDVDVLVAMGGYVVPLFTDAEYAARSAFGRRPVPGPALLHMMGGLVEQSGRFDDAIALVGFDEVRFVKPAFAGDEIRVEVEVLRKEPTAGGRRYTLVMAWRCLGVEVLAEATARMVFNAEGAP